jgi:DNA-binding response OmpR family regulator
MIWLYRCRHTQQKNTVHFQNNTFQIGQYRFNPGKNELTGFGESIQLNKKENSILYALCVKQGNVVERNALLEENWGSLGMIYSRSLDTYLTTLRKYLKKDTSIQIVTVKGVGYKLVNLVYNHG